MAQIEVPDSPNSIVGWIVAIAVAIATTTKTYFYFRKDKRADHAGEQTQETEDFRDRTYRKLIATCNDKIESLEKALQEEREARQIDLVEFRREVRLAHSARYESEERARMADENARIAQRDASEIKIEFERLSLEFIGFKERTAHPHQPGSKP